MKDRPMKLGEKWGDYIDAEEHPRNSAAIRTALMLGAEFKQDANANWSIQGIDCKSTSKTMPAFLFLVAHGIGIDNFGRAVLCKDLGKENSK